MNGQQPDEQELKIDYPTHWEYRLIGRDAAELRDAVAQAVEGVEHELNFARMSSKGSYVSMKLTLQVRDEEHRKGVWDRLAAHDGVVHLL